MQNPFNGIESEHSSDDAQHNVHPERIRSMELKGAIWSICWICESGYRNPFNGIERYTDGTFSMRFLSWRESVQWNWKEPIPPRPRTTRTKTNPFNGIERHLPPILLVYYICEESVQWNWKAPTHLYALVYIPIRQESVQWNWKKYTVLATYLNRLVRIRSMELKGVDVYER